MKTPEDIGWKMRVALGPRTREKRWLQFRQPRVTGSVYGAISGVNSYHTIWDLYQIKRGEKQPDPAGWNAKRGQLLEPAILEKMATDPARPWAFELLQCPKFVLHMEHDLIGCSPDFMAYTTDRDLCEKLRSWPVTICGEIKSRDGTKSRNYQVRDDWPGFTPSEESQVRFNTMVTGAAVGLLGVQCIQEQTIYRPIFRDLEIEQEMVRLSLEFLRCVKEGDTDGLFDLSESAEQRFNIVSKRFEDLRPAVLDVSDPAVDDLIEFLQDLQKRQRELKAQEKETKALIATHFEDYEKIETATHVATWKRATGRKSFDPAKLLAVFPGFNLDPFYKTSTPTGRGRLVIRKKDHD